MHFNGIELWLACVQRSIVEPARQIKRGFLWFQQGDKNLENVTHEEAVATLKATQDRVVLLVAKPETGIVPPPPPPIASDNSLSPQPRKPCNSIQTYIIHHPRLSPPYIVDPRLFSPNFHAPEKTNEYFNAARKKRHFSPTTEVEVLSPLTKFFFSQNGYAAFSMIFLV